MDEDQLEEWTTEEEQVQIMVDTPPGETTEEEPD